MGVALATEGRRDVQRGVVVREVWIKAAIQIALKLYARVEEGLNSIFVNRRGRHWRRQNGFECWYYSGYYIYSGCN